MLGPRQVGKTTLARQLTAQWCGLGVGGVDDLLAHPKCGASWEGFIIREIMRRNNVRRGEAFFWGVHTGAELDLLIHQNGRSIGFEIKLTRSPKITPSMRSAIEILELDHLYVMCHGTGTPWPLAEKITAVPAICLASSLWVA
jgi:predicted AAA+ superfamily ATPase